MPVFISHKSTDKPQALMIADYLDARGVSTYVDVLDPILQTTDDITGVIVRRVRQCTHLMAVTSVTTVNSW
jgi:TIR domain